MTKTQKVISILVVIAVIVSTSLLFIPKSSTDKPLGDAGYPSYLKTLTSTAVTVGPQSTTVLVPSSGRVYAIFGNAGTSTQTVFLSLNGGAATTSSGIILPSGLSYVINSFNQYVGSVTAISSSGTSTVTVTYSQ